MSYLPRADILERLDAFYDVRLINPDVIHDVDVQALWEVIETLQEELTTCLEAEEARIKGRLDALMAQREPR
jgi:hypothetical protein